MAYDGELVKMENGRWARYQRCQVYRPGVEDAGETMLLIAVEVDERYQELLDRAAESLTRFSQGASAKVRWDPNAPGKCSLMEETELSAAVH